MRLRAPHKNFDFYSTERNGKPLDAYIRVTSDLNTKLYCCDVSLYTLLVAIYLAIVINIFFP